MKAVVIPEKKMQSYIKYCKNTSCNVMCDCGYKNVKLTLRDRTWVCPVCGCVHDRDIHAAENILRRGIYELSSGSETNEATAEGLPAKAS